jgi:hypothetical protein
VRFVLPQRGLRPSVLAAVLHVAQFALDRRDQTGQFPFLDVVLGTLSHKRDGEVQIDFAGDDDEGHVGTYFFGQRQGCWGAEERHRMVRGNDIPVLLCQGGAHGLRRLDDGGGDLVATAAEHAP